MENKNSTLLIKIAIAICLIILGVLLWQLNDIVPPMATVAIIATLTVLWCSVEYVNYLQRNKKPPPIICKPSPIASFALISQEGRMEKEWHIGGAVSFLIGKSTATLEVDMELGDTHFSSYVSHQHATLNLMAGCWYIEDTDSENGVGLRRRNNGNVYRLNPGEPYEIDVGDVIYISKAKILVM